MVVVREISISFRERTKIFVSEYVKDYNATQAFVRAFGATKNASQSATSFMRHPHVRECITEVTRGRLTLAEINADRVILELGRVAFADMRKTVTTVKLADGSYAQMPIPLSQLDEDTARAISEVKYERDGTLRMKMEGKIPALTALARVTGAIGANPHTMSRTGPRADVASAHEAYDEEEIMRLMEECATEETFEDATIDMDDLSDDES